MGMCCAGSCGVMGKAVVIAALCCGTALVHQSLKPMIPKAPVDAAGTSRPSAPTSRENFTIPPVANGADPSRTFRDPSMPVRTELDAGMISLDEAKALLATGEAQWIDARSDEDYAKDRIGDALHITPEAWLGGQIPEVTHAMSRDSTVVVYCGGGSCDASKLVAVRLRGIGFKDVKVFEDGWKGWTTAKLPTAQHPEGAPGDGS